MTAESNSISPRHASMRANAAFQIESEILDSIAGAKHLKLELSQIAQSYGVGYEVIEAIAQSLVQKHIGLDLEEMEFSQVIKEVERIEKIVDPGIREWKLQTLARRHKRTPQQLMSAFNKAVCQRAPIRFRTVSEFKQEFNRPIEWLVEGWIARGVLILLHGGGGDGKTLFAYQLMKSILYGEHWNKYPASQGSVVLIQVDEPEFITVERIDVRGIDSDSSLRILSDWTVEGIYRLEAELEKAPPVAMFIDSVTVINRHSLFSENDTEYARSILLIRDMCHRLRIACILIHHSNSEGNARGTKAIHNSVDEVWGLSRVFGCDDRILHVQKTRMGRPPGRYRFALEEDLSFTYLGEQKGEELERVDPKMESRIQLWLSEDSQRGLKFTAKEISQIMNLNYNTVRTALLELVSQRRIRREHSRQSRAFVHFVERECGETLLHEEVQSVIIEDHHKDHHPNLVGAMVPAADDPMILKNAQSFSAKKRGSRGSSDHVDALAHDTASLQPIVKDDPSDDPRMILDDHPPLVENEGHLLRIEGSSDQQMNLIEEGAVSLPAKRKTKDRPLSPGDVVEVRATSLRGIRATVKQWHPDTQLVDLRAGDYGELTFRRSEVRLVKRFKES